MSQLLLITELFKSIASVNSIFLSFILTAFICHREKEVGLFYALIILTLAKVLSIYLHADTAYIAVSFFACLQRVRPYCDS